MNSLFQADKEYRKLGAIAYYDSHYPGSWQNQKWIEGRLLFRHYFNSNGTEIGFVMPDMFLHNEGVQIFDIPRIWGIEHDLQPFTA